jgi:hypothetical protein
VFSDHAKELVTSILAKNNAPDETNLWRENEVQALGKKLCVPILGLHGQYQHTKLLSQSLNLVFPPQIGLIRRIVLGQDGCYEFLRMVRKHFNVMQYIEPAVVELSMMSNLLQRLNQSSVRALPVRIW